MSRPFASGVKWYHLLFVFVGLTALLVILVWLFLSRKSVGSFLEDETDIVE